MSEVRIVNQRTGGEKGQKDIQMSLLPVEELQEVARLYRFGAQKYAPNNWCRGYDWSLSYDAMQRHVMAFWGGESTDEETGCHHLASAVFHALALMYFEKHHPELDDRQVTTVAAMQQAAAGAEELKADEPTDPARDLEYWAWTIIANANGGDWGKADPEWKAAAEKWRDAFHDSLGAEEPGETLPAPPAEEV